MTIARAYLLTLSLSFGCATAGAVHEDNPPDASLPGDGSVTPPQDGTISGACATPYTGVLGTWNFAGAPGSQAETTGSTSAPGVTVDSIRRVAGLTATAGATSMNSSNWPMQVDSSKYYTLSITPAGCAVHVTGVAIDVKSSASGPSHAELTSSADSFAQTTTLSTSAPSTPTLSVSATGSLELRITGYSASTMSGTMRVQNTLTVTGSLE